MILASTSRIRRELLGRLRVSFEAVSPMFDELRPPPGRVSVESARVLALENARGKALSLRSAYPDALILGSDQVCECEGTVLSKPGTEELACRQLRLLSGREHHLHTGVVLLSTADGSLDAEVLTTTLRLRSLSEDEIRFYVRQESPLESAGSYLSEGLGIALFEYLRGDDPTAIMGLPLVVVSRLLSDFGCSPLRSGAGEDAAVGL